MRSRRLPYLIIALCLSGCGGSSPDVAPFFPPSVTAPEGPDTVSTPPLDLPITQEPVPSPVPVQVSAERVVARVPLLWGERSRATGGLSSALSARITLQGASPDGGDLVWAIDRAPSPGAYSETYPSPDAIPVGDRQIAVEFFAGGGGSGVRVGEARAMIRLEGDGIVPAISTIGSVTGVSISPDQTVFVDTPSDLAWSATNEHGEVMAASPGSVRLAVTSGESFLRVAGGRVEGLRPGAATIRAFVDAASSEPKVIRVSSRATVNVSPESATIGPGSVLQLAARVSDAPDPSVVWSVPGGEASGAVTSDGVYTAPATLGVYAVTATSVYDAEKAATVTVTVALGGIGVEIE